MCLAQGPQRSEAREARTRGPSVSSQALYHWALNLFGGEPIVSRHYIPSVYVLKTFKKWRHSGKILEYEEHSWKVHPFKLNTAAEYSYL